MTSAVFLEDICDIYAAETIKSVSTKRENNLLLDATVLASIAMLFARSKRIFLNYV